MMRRSRLPFNPQPGVDSLENRELLSGIPDLAAWVRTDLPPAEIAPPREEVEPDFAPPSISFDRLPPRPRFDHPGDPHAPDLSNLPDVLKSEFDGDAHDLQSMRRDIQARLSDPARPFFHASYPVVTGLTADLPVESPSASPTSTAPPTPTAGPDAIAGASQTAPPVAQAATGVVESELLVSLAQANLAHPGVIVTGPPAGEPGAMRGPARQAGSSGLVARYSGPDAMDPETLATAAIDPASGLEPQGSDLISEFDPAQGGPLAVAVDRFLEQFEDLGISVPGGYDASEWAGWPATCAIAVVGLEFGRRWLRREECVGSEEQEKRRSRGPAGPFAGLPGSWSVVTP